MAATQNQRMGASEGHKQSREAQAAERNARERSNFQPTRAMARMVDRCIRLAEVDSCYGGE